MGGDSVQKPYHAPKVGKTSCVTIIARRFGLGINFAMVECRRPTALMLPWGALRAFFVSEARPSCNARADGGYLPICAQENPPGPPKCFCTTAEKSETSIPSLAALGAVEHTLFQRLATIIKDACKIYFTCWLRTVFKTASWMMLKPGLTYETWVWLMSKTCSGQKGCKDSNVDE